MWQECISNIWPHLSGYTLHYFNQDREYVHIPEEGFKIPYGQAQYLVVSCSKEMELPPFKTEEPIKALTNKLDGVIDNELFGQINRTGPFFGWYLVIK